MNIIELAKKAGLALTDHGHPEGYAVFCKRLERFAALVRADEREKLQSVYEQMKFDAKLEALADHNPDATKMVERINELEQQNAALKAVVDAWKNVEPVEQEHLMKIDANASQIKTMTPEEYKAFVEPVMKECRHCGFLCKPNPDESRPWYPLQELKYSFGIGTNGVRLVDDKEVLNNIETVTKNVFNQVACVNGCDGVTGGCNLCPRTDEPVKQEPVGNRIVGNDVDGYIVENLYAAPVNAKAIRAEALEEAAKACYEVADRYKTGTDLEHKLLQVGFLSAEYCAVAIRRLK